MKGHFLMRIFISHSSKDKERYCNSVVEKLVSKLGRDSVVYDELTFEAGEKSIDEINRTLGITDLYVILLSESAVESKWVKYELAKARDKFETQKLNKIFPLIIDPSLNYTDERIPRWLKDYNLKYIARPTKTANLIIEQAKNITNIRHPILQKRNSIFVGRNDLIDAFEVRIDDYDKPPLNAFIVSGLPNIGRKSLARQCFIKGSIVPEYYSFPTISLSYQESIEDLIIKINDLGFTDGKELNNLTSKSLEEKIQSAIALTENFSSHGEIVMIKDEGCIVDQRGFIAEWFRRIISSIYERIVFVIITKYRTSYETIRNVPSATFINVPEMNQSERRGLLRRLSDAFELSLTRSELDLISKHLTGYPAQVHYSIDIIKDRGFPYLKTNFKLLSDFNEQEVSLLLEKYRDNNMVFEILALIGKYDAISITMLYEILSTTDGYIECYENLYQESFFELEGINREYVRVNEVVRNYIMRSGTKINKTHREKAQELFKLMFEEESSSWYNSNDFLLAIRESVIKGHDIPQEHIIPSVYLKSMSDLYSNMQYDSVVELARLALSNSDNTDERIMYEIQYLLCSALAKLRKNDCLNEIQKLDDDDRNFLCAFYYRQIGKNDRALIFLNNLLKKRPEMSKAKREKVLVLKNLLQFEEATGLAKENYYQFSDNPYHIQAYFDCLINTYSKSPEDDLLTNLLEKLGRINSEKARSMYGRCKALYMAYVEKDYPCALEQINETISEFPNDKKYALVVKFDIAQLFHNINEMENVINEMELDKVNKNSIANNSIVICKTKLMVEKHKTDDAIKYFNKHIMYFTEESKIAFCEKVRQTIK